MTWSTSSPELRLAALGLLGQELVLLKNVLLAVPIDDVLIRTIHGELRRIFEVFCIEVDVDAPTITVVDERTIPLAEQERVLQEAEVFVRIGGTSADVELNIQGFVRRLFGCDR